MWAIVRKYDNDGPEIEISWVATEKLAQRVSEEYEKNRGVKPYVYTYHKSKEKK